MNKIVIYSTILKTLSKISDIKGIEIEDIIPYTDLDPKMTVFILKELSKFKRSEKSFFLAKLSRKIETFKKDIFAIFSLNSLEKKYYFSNEENLILIVVSLYFSNGGSIEVSDSTFKYIWNSEGTECSIFLENYSFVQRIRNLKILIYTKNTQNYTTDEHRDEEEEEREEREGYAVFKPYIVYTEDENYLNFYGGNAKIENSFFEIEVFKSSKERIVIDEIVISTPGAENFLELSGVIENFISNQSIVISEL
jgi:hypothetical protein